MLTGQRPHPGTGRRPSRVDRLQRRWRVRGERVEGAGHRRVRGHSAIDAGLGPQQRDVGQAVPAQRQRHRQVEDDLAGVVDRERLAPRRQRCGQRRVQTGSGHGVDQQHPTGLPDRRHPSPVDPDAGIEPATLLHLEGAPRSTEDGPSASPIFPGQEHLSVDQHPVIDPRRESPGLTGAVTYERWPTSTRSRPTMARRPSRSSAPDPRSTYRPDHANSCWTDASSSALGSSRLIQMDVSPAGAAPSTSGSQEGRLTGRAVDLRSASRGTSSPAVTSGVKRRG
jgi:hypothetical protein